VASAIEQGFKSQIWMTFRQALELKAHVRKGEKGSLVVYANSITKTAPNDAGEEVEREIHFLKGYTVFNIKQIECLPKHYHFKPEPKFAPVQRIEQAETFFAATPADVRYGGGRAYYAQEADYIQLPAIESFRAPESSYATLAHECTHWTKHPSRLERDFDQELG
jgi:antirestriction protein ArdC